VINTSPLITDHLFSKEECMENAVYCLATSEPQANAILTHLRNLGFTASEVSILLKQDDTRNISVKEDALRGAAKGGIAGSFAGVLLTTLTIPVLGPLAVAGPILSAIGGAAAGGIVGGLAGGSGALTRMGLEDKDGSEIERRLQDGAILIAVHSTDPARRDKAVRVFKSEGAESIYGTEDLAA
jgi:outer membrane lipoprotein SlyB